MDQEKFDYFLTCFEAAFRKITSQINDLEFKQSDETQTIPEKRFAAIVGVIGFNQGRVHVQMNESLARKLYAYVNGEEADEDMDLCFYLAEFTNMIAGHGITALNAMYKISNLRLTPPAIFAGNNLEIGTPKTKTAVKFYSCKDGVVKLEIGFEGA